MKIIFRMELKQTIESPFSFFFSFSPYIDKLKKLSESNIFFKEKYRNVFELLNKNPKLSGNLSLEMLEENGPFFKLLLADLFPPLLTDNEIKVVSIPFSNLLFNPSERLQKILEDAGNEFDMQISGFDEDQLYILSCCVILKAYYNTPFQIDYPFTYRIPSKDGYTNYYRALTNSEFLEIEPTSEAKILSPEEVTDLIDQYNNIELWKEKFPPHSWKVKGFAIMNFYDATTEVAISNLKSKLLQPREDNLTIREDITHIFRSIFRVADLELGFTAINAKENKFEKTPINTVIESNILGNEQGIKWSDKIWDEAFPHFIEGHHYYSISDTKRYNEEHPKSYLAQHFLQLGIQSVIFAPIFRDQQLLGIIELTSKSLALNSINANKMDGVIIYLEETLNQLYINLENHVAALIQKEYTSIHPSVYWKFHDEAMKHINLGGDYLDHLPYRSIVFQDLIPLFGESDVRNSSMERNKAILKDLKTQLDLINNVLKTLSKNNDVLPLLQLMEEKQSELQHGLKANTEVDLQLLFTEKVHPFFDKIKFASLANNREITNYYNHLEPGSKLLYQQRKRFDESIAMINRELSQLLDQRQEEQQKKFPFFFERFKTDGVEHNIYIGQSIAPWLSYDNIYLHNIRLWQLRAITESEQHFQKLKERLPHNLNITSLIFAYSTPINIRFRMDEKRFDVDGSYNARYEMIKKRIDKVLIKNSSERLVKVGHISIVFSIDKEKEEYLNLISILQKEGHLTSSVEIVELEDLQGIIGLKALRIGVNYPNFKMDYPFYTEMSSTTFL